MSATRFYSPRVHIRRPFISACYLAHSSRMIVYKYNYVGLQGNPKRIQEPWLTATMCVLSPYLDRHVCYRDQSGLDALPGQACVTETLLVLSPYNRIQYNFIAKCQYNCTGMFCGAKYTHHTLTPIIKHH